MVAQCNQSNVARVAAMALMYRSGWPVMALHILDCGVVMRGKVVHKAPEALGLEMLVSERPVARSKATFALSHCLTLSIDRQAYQEVVREYPAMAAMVKSNVVKDRVREGVRSSRSPHCTVALHTVPGSAGDGMQRSGFAEPALLAAQFQ